MLGGGNPDPKAAALQKFASLLDEFAHEYEEGKRKSAATAAAAAAMNAGDVEAATLIGGKLYMYINFIIFISCCCYM